VRSAQRFFAIALRACCAALFLTACSATSGSFSPHPDGLSRTGLLLSDIHFDPLDDPTLGNQLAKAPTAQWDSILSLNLPSIWITDSRKTLYP